MRLSGRRALVIGFGRSGRASAGYLRQQGVEVRVVDRADTPELRAAVESAGVLARLGGYQVADLDGVDLVVVSPGVAWDLPLVEAARGRGLPITSELDMFFQACPCPIAGITGTNGKTTTTALTAEVFDAGGLRVMRGGNIGEPVLDRVAELTASSWVVLELSSFQLESITHPRLRIGSILNITPDHLDRHGTLDRYMEIKSRAVAFMDPDDHAVLNMDDPRCVQISRKTPGHLLPFSTRIRPPGDAVFVQEGAVHAALQGGTDRIIALSDVPLPGEHNLSNVLAAVGMGRAAGVLPPAIAQAVAHFKGVEHRLELVGTFNGVRWYNDSKATNPDSTFKALAAFSDPIVLIAGGRNKGIDVQPLAQAIAKRVQALVAIGETGEELARSARAEGLRKVTRADDLRDAVRQAARVALPGSLVLLSPGFASYDMFLDYEDRGRRFKAAVREELAG